MSKISLKRDAILKKAKKLIRMEWFQFGDNADDGFYIREMTGTVYEKYIDDLKEKETVDEKTKEVKIKSIGSFRADLACRTICDETGELIFTLEDIDSMNEVFGSDVLNRIAKVATAVNGMSDIQDKAKN